MKPNRIYFKNNPWPEGHPIDEFKWSARVVDGKVWFDMHLTTSDYYSEREIDDEYDEYVDTRGETGYARDWYHAGVWYNYHRCIMSSSEWHQGGFMVCRLRDYSPEFLDGKQAKVDIQPGHIDDWSGRAFHIYLLGHDAVAYHNISFKRQGETDMFTIDWRGKIAMAYIGQSEYVHEFSARIEGAQFPHVKCRKWWKFW